MYTSIFKLGITQYYVCLKLTPHAAHGGENCFSNFGDCFGENTGKSYGNCYRETPGSSRGTATGLLPHFREGLLAIDGPASIVYWI